MYLVQVVIGTLESEENQTMGCKTGDEDIDKTDQNCIVTENYATQRMARLLLSEYQHPHGMFVGI